MRALQPRVMHSGKIAGELRSIQGCGKEEAQRRSAWLMDGGATWAPTNKVRCARPSWRVPAGASPARVRGSSRLVVSVAPREVTTTAKRTQRLFGVWE